LQINISLGNFANVAGVARASIFLPLDDDEDLEDTETLNKLDEIEAMYTRYISVEEGYSSDDIVDGKSVADNKSDSEEDGGIN